MDESALMSSLISHRESSTTESASDSAVCEKPPPLERACEKCVWIARNCLYAENTSTVNFSFRSSGDHFRGSASRSLDRCFSLSISLLMPKENLSESPKSQFITSTNSFDAAETAAAADATVCGTSDKEASAENEAPKHCTAISKPSSTPDWSKALCATLWNSIGRPISALLLLQNSSKIVRKRVAPVFIYSCFCMRALICWNSCCLQAISLSGQPLFHSSAYTCIILFKAKVGIVPAASDVCNNVQRVFLRSCVSEIDSLLQCFKQTYCSINVAWNWATGLQHVEGCRKYLLASNACSESRKSVIIFVAATGFRDNSTHTLSHHSTVIVDISQFNPRNNDTNNN